MGNESILSPEQETAMLAELDGQATDAPATTATTDTKTAQEEVTYKEPVTPVADTKTTEPAAEIPKSVRMKVQGQEVEIPVFEGGKINPLLVERLSMGEDYYRKTQTLAEERRAYQEKFQAEVARAREEIMRQARLPEAPKKEDALPDLPDDDPYAKGIKLTHQRLQAMEQQLRESMARTEQAQQYIAQQEQARKQAESNALLARKEEEIKKAYSLEDAEVRVVEAEWLRRYRAGEQIPMEKVAEERVAYINSLKDKAVEEWKTKHKVTTPGTPVKVPTTGTAAPEIDMRSDRFLDMIKSKLNV